MVSPVNDGQKSLARIRKGSCREEKKKTGRLTKMWKIECQKELSTGQW